MKTFVLATAALLATLQARAEACLDFSGHYATEAVGRSDSLRIEQTGCERLFALYTYATGTRFERPMIFDDVLRLLYAYQGIESREASYMKHDAIVFRTEDFYPIGFTERSRGRLFFEGDRLIEEITLLDADGEPRRIVRTEYLRKSH